MTRKQQNKLINILIGINRTNTWFKAHSIFVT